jgi:hypothetical protein
VPSVNFIWLFLIMRFGNRDFKIYYGLMCFVLSVLGMKLHSDGILKLLHALSDQSFDFETDRKTIGHIYRLVER